MTGSYHAEVSPYDGAKCLYAPDYREYFVGKLDKGFIRGKMDQANAK